MLKEYLELTIQTKKGMKKRIYELEKQVKVAKENELFAINEMNKYKSKYLQLKRKLKKEEKCQQKS